MDDLYGNFCDKIEDIQKDIDEVDNYLETIKKLKDSNFIPESKSAISTIEEILEEKKAMLQTNWAQTYNSLLAEADVLVEACDCVFSD